MRSSACSVSIPILLETCVAETITSEFLEDFTSMRPLATFCSTMTGRPFTAKCLSKCCGAACTKAQGKRSTPAPSAGSIRRPTVFRLMLVSAPPAFHHHGYQFRLLLVSAAQIFARQIILRLIFYVLLAIDDKVVHDIQILAQRYVHIGTAGKLHGRQMSFVVGQRYAGVPVEGIVRVASFRGLRGRALQLQSGGGDNQQNDGGGSQHARREKFGKTVPPGVPRAGPDDAFRFQLQA